jgi:tetratricopeptide (TPR) repeat protein
MIAALNFCLKGKRTKFMKQTLMLLLLMLASCGPTAKKLSEMDYDEYVVKRDEALANKAINEKTLSGIVEAQNDFGNKAFNAGELDKAETIFNKTLEISNQNKPAKYGLAMIKGHRFYKKGSKTALWDALEQYGKASYHNSESGEPNYWMGRTYEKKDDGDYELIIEAYENALQGILPLKLITDAEARLAAAKKKQQTFQDFWK